MAPNATRSVRTSPTLSARFGGSAFRTRSSCRAASGWLLVSWFIFRSRQMNSALSENVVNQCEYAWNEEECRDGGAHQTADDGAAERRVLFAAFTHAHRHRDHTYDHRKSRHN